MSDILMKPYMPNRPNTFSGLLLLWGLLFCTLNLSAQVTIGGNVYGGGNEGNTGGNTNVTIKSCEISGNVFGGARMADVDGRAFVNIDGLNTTGGQIKIKAVYGGNDIAGTVGKNIDPNATTTTSLPSQLTEVGTEEGKNNVNDSWTAIVRTSKMPTEDKTNRIIVGTIFGGGNGDYNYFKPGDVTGKDTNDDDITASQYEVRDKTTGALIAESATAFALPTLPKAYLELTGGCLAHVYGGGNNVTVTQNTTICINNSSSGLEHLLDPTRMREEFQDLARFVDLNMFQGVYTSLDFNFGRVFGGNNKAEMKIRPVWNVQQGIIRDIYSGGNEGDMTSPDGLILDINPLPANAPNLYIVNVYGGCRKADVHPMRNGSEVGSADVQLPVDMGYKFPAGLPARVVTRGGDITNVYGGNDITGRVWGGTAIGIYTSIRGDVYGGGNGSYAYTNNPALKDDPNYRDFYYEVPAGKTSIEALNDHRPHVEQTSLRLWGKDPAHRTIIGGSVYVGGNSATVIENPSLANPILHLKIGSNVIVDNVFLGNNGVQMVGESAQNVLEIYKSQVEVNGVMENYVDFDLEDPVTVAKYMEGCAMSLHPSIVFDDAEKNGDPDTYVPYSSMFGSLFCGGNVGSMTWPGTLTIDIEHPVVIYDKFVTGCNNAYMPAIDSLCAVYWGGLTGITEELQEHGMEDADGNIKDAVIVNLSGLKIQPKRWVTKRNANYDQVDANGSLLPENGKPVYLANCTEHCELSSINAVCEHGNQPYLEWNTFDVTTGKDVANPAELASGSTRNSTADDVHRRLKGGNIYGGCYATGFVNGNVVINVNETIMDRDEIFAQVEEDEEGEGIYYNSNEYHITKFNSGVIIDEQGMDVLGKAMNIFGGGYGAGTEIWGSATINLKEGYVFQVFGGAEKGVIGRPKTVYTSGVPEYPTTNLSDGQFDEDGNYAFNGYLYIPDERTSTYINLDGSQAGVSRHSEHDTPSMAETEFIYGGAFEGPIMGNAVVHLGNGRIFNSFAGSCNADIMGHTETYVGINADEQTGFPFIRDHIYGGNDLGGKIYGSKDFKDRVREDVSGIKDNIYDKQHSTVASAYVEYQQGRVDYIFGGCYGTYDYTDPEYAEYFYTTGGTGTTSENLGKARLGYSKPYLNNAFVNFRPVISSNPLNKALRVYGAGQGITEEKEIDVMQDRSYVLIDIPSMTTFHDLIVFGAGSSCGLGMSASPTEALANPDAYSAVVDLFRGDISEGNVYGGSFTEGVTRRTVVNVPPISTIKVKNIFGGAYGVTNTRPCDVYEAIVNYNSDNAQISDKIYGGNNAYRRTFYGKVNVSSPVWSDKTKGYTATVYGAGYGEDTWSQYTEVNLNDGAEVYEVYGGGQRGKVLNLESVNAWKAAVDTLYTDISPDPNSLYVDLGLASDVANYSQLELDREAEIVNIEDSWRDRGTTYTKKKYNTNVSIKEGANVSGYCYGGGLGYNDTPTSGDVYGTTYIDLLGGTVHKDLYGAGTTGAVMDGKRVADDGDTDNDFIASANVYIKGGSVRNVYGGGWEGPVGYHDETTTTTDDDILGETHVVIGVLDGPCDPDPSLTNTSGIPTIQRNAYGGGEGGVIYGTANITLNNGYIGYVYNPDGSDDASTLDFDEHYVEKIADETYGDGNNVRLQRAGNLFGSGYADNSNADFTNVYLYGGVVRGGAYGGGEIGTVGRGSNSSGNITIHKPGKSHLSMYGGHVMQDVFGGGRGFDNLNRVSALGTGGYIFGLTDVNIYGGEVGTVGGVANGYGNVFGGGNLGYVYSGSGTKSDTDGYYYNSTTGLLTEDCRVIVAPACPVLCGQTISLNDHTYTAGQYVPAEDLNFLQNKYLDAASWNKLNVDGVTIRNAVFAGGNVSSGSDQVYANTVTVYGNATATLYDIYNRDLITIGTEHVGGLYGDGNLTFVDGYRELNVSNYGTDYFGLSDNITYEEYLHLTDRERDYFKLEYKCISAYTSPAGSLDRTVALNERITSEDYDIMSDEEKAHWELGGFCTIYAGRLLNTLQRADFVGVFGSRMVMQGAQDRVPEVVDYTNYTINRVGELSLNRSVTQAGDTGIGAEHGSYFGIYNIVNYLGALTSDVDFYDGVRTTDQSNPSYQPESDGQTYQEWKAAHMGERKRNNGTAENKVALASGVYLELTTEESTADNKVWGLVTGVCQLDLINVMTGLGGGYVYAKNEHGARSSSGNNHTILSPYNMAGYGHARAVTNKIYTYSTSDLQTYETSGNFIHNTKQIIDDCYPTSGNYSGPDAAPAHYWYIRGEIYVYDQIISAYTGSASAYAESINLPLTITPSSNGTLQLSDVKENLYAFYDNTTAGSQTTIGPDGVLIGTKVYHLNEPITYWDWYLLNDEDRKHFVKQTYVSTAQCTLADGTTVVPEGTVLLPSEYVAWKADNANVTAPTLDSRNPVPFDDVFHMTNNVSHNNGYILSYDMSNPRVWDRYYTPPTGASISDNVANKVTTAAYTDSPSSYPEYIGAPTYSPTTSGVYGQREYGVGDLIPNDIYEKYAAIATNGHSYPANQATVVRAYVATDEANYTIGTGTEAVEHHVYKGYAISKDEYDQLDASTKAKFQIANICTSTIELGNNEFVFYGDLLTNDEIDENKAKYRTFLLSQGIDDSLIDEKVDADFAASVSNAWYCTSGGKYGGDYYEAAKNYRALDAWSSMSPEDRAIFKFNYDSFDTLIDPDFAGRPARYDGPNDNTPTLQTLYSDITPVDYTATYEGTSSTDTDPLTYTDKNGASHSIAVGSVIDRVDFENIPNEKRFYQSVSISDPGTYYFVKVPFTRGDIPYTAGTLITETIYNSLDDNQKLNVMTQEFTSEQLAQTHTFYFCRKPYTINAKGEGYAVEDIEGNTHDLNSDVTVGTIITDHEYNQLPNKQVNFTIHGDVPVGTSTLYVARESDINNLSEEKVITVIYNYIYEESDESGTHIEEINEKHVINIHLQFKSGVPSISELEKPTIVLPNSTVGLKQPNVTPGAFEIIGGGWEMFTNQSDAEHHTNGIPYFNNLTPMYWYQNDYYVAYYAKSYLGKTYSNAVQFSVANYHDLDAVMNHPRHLFVDHEDVLRPCKIYIDDRECTDDTKSELDLLKDFYDLTLHNTMDGDGNPTTISDGSSVDDHLTVNDYIRGGNNLEFILQSDISPKAYTTWTPIGDATQCFEGVFHGNGYTISDLSNSLFGHLCGDVYNLGVTGSFTAAGIVDSGSGYVENCWISTTGTPESGVRAVFNNPNRSQLYKPVTNNATLTAGKTYYTDNTGGGEFIAEGTEVSNGTNYFTKATSVQVVNCYYPEDNAYDETENARGNAIKKPRQSFYNGEVAFNLNGFYLNKRYNDHLSTTPSGYPYKYFDADDLDSSNKPRLKRGGYETETDYTLGYVESYYADGDFIYAGGTIPEGDNERYASTEGKFYPIWPDDYLFFGQMLTYGHESSRQHQTHPAHVNKSNNRLTTTAISVNRVYRAPAYFRNSTMGVAYYNPYAVFAAKSADNTHTAYPNMTAIDFTGSNGDLSRGYQKGLVNVTTGMNVTSEQFYPPLLDNDGLTYFRNVDLTRNLLAYTPASTGNDNEAATKTYTAVMAGLMEPAYAEGRATGTGYVAGKENYRTVAAQDVTIIHGHAVVETADDTYTATNDHFLVDRQDFNAPISYTFASGKRMWHQRVPDSYVDLEKGWEAISLPFQAELVTTNQKGEISHFYQDHTIGHEYWLREFRSGGTTTTEGDIYKGVFNYPDKSTTDKSYTNTFFWDYYYQEAGVVRLDANEDKYDWDYYSTGRTLKDYPYSVAAKPYIIGFPGTTYYEFDLSGNFKANNTLHDVTQLRKQTITFASAPAITIRVSDTETLPTGTAFGGDTYDGFTFRPSYLNESFDAGTNIYTLKSNYDSDGDTNDDCSSFVKVPATGDATTVQAFRPYFAGASGSPVKEFKAPRAILFNSIKSSLIGEDESEPDEFLDGELTIWSTRGRILVRSGLKEETTVRIVNAGGALVSTYTIQPGQTVQTRVAPGVYIVNKKKIAAR